MQVKVEQRLVIAAASRAQQPPPERGQLLPSWAQLPMMVLCHLPKMPQTQFCDDGQDLRRHCEQRSCHASVQAGGVPRDHERVIHHLDGELTWQKARGRRRASAPGMFLTSPLPPFRVPEMNVDQQKWAAAGALAGRWIECQPQLAMFLHDFRGRMRPVGVGDLRQQSQQSPVELMHKVQTRAANPFGRG